MRLSHISPEACTPRQSTRSFPCVCGLVLSASEHVRRRSARRVLRPRSTPDGQLCRRGRCPFETKFRPRLVSKITYPGAEKLALIAAVLEIQAHLVLTVELEGGGVGLAGLAPETLHLSGAPSREELFRLSFAEALARDLLPDGEVAAGLLPRRATVGFLRLDNRGTALGAGTERLAAAGRCRQPLPLHTADLFDELCGEPVYVGQEVGAALRTFLHLREPLLPAGREFGRRERALPEEPDE